VDGKEVVEASWSEWTGAGRTSTMMHSVLVAQCSKLLHGSSGDCIRITTSICPQSFYLHEDEATSHPDEQGDSRYICSRRLTHTLDIYAPDSKPCMHISIWQSVPACRVRSVADRWPTTHDL
jgi:hypothetical protein